MNAFIFLMKNQLEAYSLAVWSSYVEILGPVCSLVVAHNEARFMLP